MKKFINLTLLCSFLLGIVVFSGCNGGDDTEPDSELDKRKAALQGIWTGTATLGGTTFENVTVTITQGNFVAGGVDEGSTDLPVSGTWTIQESDLNKVIITEDVSLNITLLNDTRLNFTTTAPEDKTSGSKTITYNLSKNNQ